MSWAQLLADLGPGRRVVVRYRIEGGFTDALGVLVSIDDLAVVIETRKGPVTVILTAVVAAKPVPPPPASRAARHSG